MVSVSGIYRSLPGMATANRRFETGPRPKGPACSFLVALRLSLHRVEHMQIGFLKVADTQHHGLTPSAHHPANNSGIDGRLVFAIDVNQALLPACRAAQRAPSGV